MKKSLNGTIRYGAEINAGEKIIFEPTFKVIPREIFKADMSFTEEQLKAYLEKQNTKREKAIEAMMKPSELLVVSDEEIARVKILTELKAASEKV